MTDNDKTACRIVLKDGRNLGYAEFGDPDGKPAFYFHGFPSCRLEAALVSEKLAKSGVWLIAIDRPGMGFSDFKPKRTILDWPADVLELADALELDKFAVIGVSGGAPFAAACAYNIPDRLTVCGILSGMSPIDFNTKGMRRANRILFFIARRFPWFFRLIMWLTYGRKAQDKEYWRKVLPKAAKRLSEPDQGVYLDPTSRDRTIETVSETFRQGTKGVTLEGKLYGKPWGFKLEDISPKIKIHIFHGKLDVNVPISMARAMAEAIPNCETRFYPNEAHLSTILNNFDEIVNILAS